MNWEFSGVLGVLGFVKFGVQLVGLSKVLEALGIGFHLGY